MLLFKKAIRIPWYIREDEDSIIATMNTKDHTSSTGSNNAFYEKIPCFDQFLELTKDEHFHKAPDDWFIVITDVKGSTKAILEGKYKDVNTIGAASILAVQNAIDIDFPYVFGGDGASLLIPPSHINIVKKTLGALKTLSKENFGLELRVGVVDVATVVQVDQDVEVEVAKFRMAPKQCVAIIRGGGLAVAETLIKDPNSQYEVAAQDPMLVSLAGLSCRWLPIPNRQGTTLSLLVISKPRDKERQKEIYKNVLTALREVLYCVDPNGLEKQYHPVNTERMKLRDAKENLRAEQRLNPTASATIGGWRLTQHRLFRFVVSSLFQKSRAFHKHMTEYSDYRKFDDALRMVIDCSKEQVERLRMYLEEHRQKGDLYYGMHLSESSLMTCLAPSMGGSIHFIDGDDGGYAMAAKQMKEQIKMDMVEE